MGTKAIPIYIPAKRPRIGTIGKNHIQSSSNLSGTALFVVCSESDTFLKNYIMYKCERTAWKTDSPFMQLSNISVRLLEILGRR